MIEKKPGDVLRLEELAHRLPPEVRVRLLDVGSIGGLKGRWSALTGRVDSFGFDPREKSKAPVTRGSQTIYPSAVGATDGNATLYVTRFGNMSSTLQPNDGHMGKFYKWAGRAEVVSHMPLEVKRVDDLLGLQMVDAVKVDTQGSEIDILRGSESLVQRGVMVAEVEVSFFARYRNQPLAGDVFAYMASQGFDLIDVYQMRRYQWNNTRLSGYHGEKGLGRSGQLAYGDAIFFRSDKDLAEIIDAAPNKAIAVATAILLFLVYGKVDIASALFDKFRRYCGSSMEEMFDNFFQKSPSLAVRGEPVS